MSSDDPDILERDFERLRRDSILKQPGRRRMLNLWVPETRPGILSRRFARHDRSVAMPPVRSELAR
jgi:hypothetical protein